jgi:hypothetical protein
MFDCTLLLNKKLPSQKPASQVIFMPPLQKRAAARRKKSRYEHFLDVSMGERDLLPVLCKAPCMAI